MIRLFFQPFLPGIYGLILKTCPATLHGTILTHFQASLKKVVDGTTSL